MIITSSKRKSSSSEVFYKIGVLKNFTKFTGKHLYRSLFQETYKFIKTSLRHKCFLCFCKIFKNICKRLLLKKKASTVTIRSKGCQKFGVFCTEERVFLFSNICGKKKWGNAYFRLGTTSIFILQCLSADNTFDLVPTLFIDHRCLIIEVCFKVLYSCNSL